MKNNDFKTLRTSQQQSAKQRESAETLKAAAGVVRSQVDALDALQGGMKKLLAGLESMSELMPGSVDPDQLAEMREQSEKNDAMVEAFRQMESGMDEAVAVVADYAEEGDHGRS